MCARAYLAAHVHVDVGDGFDWAAYLREGIELPSYSDSDSEVCSSTIMYIHVYVLIEWCVSSSGLNYQTRNKRQIPKYAPCTWCLHSQRSHVYNVCCGRKCPPLPSPQLADAARSDSAVGDELSDTDDTLTAQVACENTCVILQPFLSYE